MVSKKRWRESRLGRFVTPSEAKAHPDTTVGETLNNDGDILAKLRWRVQTCESVMSQAAGDLRNMVMHQSVSDDKLSDVAGNLEHAAWERIPEEDA